MAAQARAIEGGFAEPVFAAQSVFRSLMEAMARPGTIHDLPALIGPPAPLSPEAGAVALTLCDHDTPLWLAPALKDEDTVAAWLGFQTGAPVTPTPAEAHFAFSSDPATLIGLENFAQGIQSYPDRSTTLVLQVATLDGGAPLTLHGPGIETSAHIAPDPLPRRFVEQWAQNNARFPRGVDLVFVTRDALAALSRTTRITATGE